MAKFKIVNGVQVEMTAEEQAARETEEAAANTEQAANAYKRSRTKQYPSIKEQMDMQYWDSVNGTTKWKDAIAKVKADNPKPS
tara:strand:- start:44 stop:292 length:249 start_codon:yes stop_codon:yes gene_type:complete